MSKSALVTGAAGFVGRHISDELVRRGWDVDRRDIADSPSNDALDIFTNGRNYGPVDLVVHCAARSPNRAAIDAEPGNLAYNVTLDAAMFGWAARTHQRRVLYFSSCAVLDGPDDYGWTKLTGERMAKAARRLGVAVTVVRPYSGYGADQTEDFPFGAFIARAKRHEDPFEVWNPDAVRDWIHIDDVVGAALALVDAGVRDPVSLCTGFGTSMAELIAMVTETVGYRPKLIPRRDKPQGVDYRVGDPGRMRGFYTPRVSLAEGIKRALE